MSLAVERELEPWRGPGLIYGTIPPRGESAELRIPFGTHLAATRALAARSVPQAWLASLCAEGALLARAFGAAACTRISRANPRGVVLVARHAREVHWTVEQHRLRGVWDYVPRLDAADHLIVRIPDETGTRYALVPLAGARFVERGGADALRGIEFCDVQLDVAELPGDALVDEARLLDVVHCGAERLQRPAGLDDSAFASVMTLGATLGCAEAAYRDYVAATRRRVAAVDGRSVAQFRHVQVRIGEIAAELAAAVRTFETIEARMRSCWPAGHAIDSTTSPNGASMRSAPREDALPDAAAALDAQRAVAALRRDAVFLARSCLELVTRLVRQMGAQGLVDSNPVQRHFRDLRAIASESRLDFERHMVVFGHAELAS